MASPYILHPQMDSELILPTKPDDPVKLGLVDFEIAKVESLACEYLSVFVDVRGGVNENLAVQGKYKFKDNHLEFTPYFPFERGFKYVVRYRSLNNAAHFSYQSFLIGEEGPTEKAEVIGIYPSADILPENLLRFYIYFNTPMKKGQSLIHIQLTDSEGNVDSRAFMEFKYELWSSDRKRLTILFDPGRIKRGVATNLELGPALQEGESYELKILGSWQDIYGNEMIKDFTKRFMTEKAYRQHINISNWEIQEPSLHSFDTLNIYCDRLMDHALIQSMIEIQDEHKNPITGHWHTSENEQNLHFVAENEWASGKYRIFFRKELEDIAGNNLESLLDQVETFSDEIPISSQVIHFEI